MDCTNKTKQKQARTQKEQIASNQKGGVWRVSKMGEEGQMDGDGW